MASKSKSRLSSYRAKRHFSVTPEPSPEEPAARKSGTRFVIHKHDASRLHYDLRLEMYGVLVSWAIPKGPTFDTNVRRLAVQTEDHPLSYGDFEGRIPDGEYGGGDSLLWERGTWRTEPPGQEHAMMAKGHLVFELEGHKLHGRWHLVRTRGKGPKSQWLFFKGRDEHATADRDVVAERPESVVSGRRVTRGPVTKKLLAAPHPAPVELLLKVWPPMNAVLSSAEAQRDRDAIYEVKYDGYRAIAGLSRGQISLQSRNGLDLAAQFPAVVKGLRDVVAAEAVLDGEVIALDPQGNARFQDLQRSEGELRYAVFDLLWLDGEDLRARPLEERRDLLESLLANVAPPVVLAERLAGTLDEALTEARRRELEGMIVKRTGSVYRSGQRGPEWAKVKIHLAQEMAIVGYTPISNGRPAVGALLLGVREGKTWRYAGKVGTGFTDKMRRDLFETLGQHRVDAKERPSGAPKMKGAVWVKPRLVAQISFREWTGDGRVRQPVFQGLRDDKNPKDCAREKPGPGRAARIIAIANNALVGIRAR